MLHEIKLAFVALLAAFSVITGEEKAEPRDESPSVLQSVSEAIDGLMGREP